MIIRFKGIRNFVSKFYFGKKKKDQGDQQELQKQLASDKQIAQESDLNDEEYNLKLFQIAVQKKDYKRSSLLYEKYLIAQQRPMLSKDKYQIHLSIIMHRFPIFLPYNKHIFQSFRDRYIYSKKLGYYNEAPKQLYQMAFQSPVLQFQRTNIDNVITHRQKRQSGGDLLYTQNSKFWKLVDPNIRKDNSIQNHPSEMVFLIVKKPSGYWQFPSRAILEKEDFDAVKKNFVSQILGTNTHNIYWPNPYPVYITRQERQLQRGVGVKMLFYHASHLTGTFKFDGTNKLFSEYAWVPKGRLSEYFNNEYFKKVIRSVTTLL